MLVDQQAAATMVVMVEAALMWLVSITQVQGCAADHTAGLPGIGKLHRSV